MTRLLKRLYMLKPGFIDMARDEIRALEPDESEEIIGNVCIRGSAQDLSLRLALTRSVHEFLFKSTIEGFVSALSSFDWSRFSPESFYVATHGTSDLSVAQVAGVLAPLLDYPKADVEEPELRIDVFVEEDAVIVGANGVFITQDWDVRKAHNRPAHHPSSLHPMVARACVNLTGAWSECVFDPMCGTGGFLIEAGLMGLCCKGADLDKEMIARARKNLEYFSVNATLEVADVTKLSGSVDCIVTDLPYGRGTKNIDRKELYPRIMSAIKRVLKKRAVVIFPSDVDYIEMIESVGLRVVSEYTRYIHKTLSTKIVVLEPITT